MKYISIDLETTCLSPKQPDRILQIAMVYEDSNISMPLKELPSFRAIIFPKDEIVGSPTALAMNGWLLIAMELFKTKMSHEAFFKYYSSFGIPNETLAKAKKACRDNYFGSLGYITEEAIKWLNIHFDNKKINVAGKNVAGFDVQFLPKEITAKFSHKYIDPGSVYIDWNDKDIKSSNKIAEMLGFDNVSHDAYDDAINATYWRIYVPKGVAGTCSGNIVFGAIRGTGT